MNSAWLTCIVSRGGVVGGKRCIHRSTSFNFAVPVGQELTGFDFLKSNKEKSVVALQRDEYPEWVDSLAKPLKTLAELKKMEFEDATDRERMRYLVLGRRKLIKDNNLEGK